MSPLQKDVFVILPFHLLVFYFPFLSCQKSNLRRHLAILPLLSSSSHRSSSFVLSVKPVLSAHIALIIKESQTQSNHKGAHSYAQTYAVMEIRNKYIQYTHTDTHRYNPKYTDNVFSPMSYYLEFS